MTITGKWAKGLVAAAIISFGINLFLAGFLVSGGWHGRFGQHFGMGAGWGGGGMFGGHRSQFHEAVHDRMAELGFDRDQMRAEMRATAEKVAELITAENVDRAALDQAVAPMAEKMKGAIDAMRGAIIDMATSMPLEERKEMAETLLRHRR